MTTTSLFLERLRRPEVEAALEAGMTTVVVPCGAVEQHGPHLPLFVDAEHGTRLGAEVAQRMGNALVAPTIRVGCSEHHLAFAGSLSLREETFRAVCQDYCTSLAHHGFRYICMLPSHGGNCKPLADVVEKLDASVGTECRVVAFTDLVGAIKQWKQIVEEEAGVGDRVGGHADIAESSIMLCLHPDLVREDLAEPGFLPELTDEMIQRIIDDGMQSVTPNGILGDARGMSAEIGEKCIAAMADLMAEFFKGGRGRTAL
jgi:creatinine amidohydrolase